ncbi:MAG: hypothetical protein K0S60_174 [Evtepia sp.]|nr:hypothetical protein [Evtepia sp.]
MFLFRDILQLLPSKLRSWARPQYLLQYALEPKTIAIERGIKKQSNPIQAKRMLNIPKNK